MIDQLQSNFVHLICAILDFASVGNILEIESIFVALLLSVAILAFKYSKNNGRNESLWRKNALLTQCIKPKQIGALILATISSTVLYSLCSVLFAFTALLFLGLQFYRLSHICTWIYDETKPPTERKYIRNCLNRYIDNLYPLNSSSIGVLCDILNNGSEELNVPKLIKKSVETIECVNCSQSTAFNIACMIGQSIISKKINVFEPNTLDQLVSFSTRHFNDVRIATAAHTILDALIDVSLDSSLNNMLFEKIWNHINENKLNQSNTYNLVRYITTKCLKSTQGGPERASSDSWNIIRNIVTNDDKQKGEYLAYAASRGALDAYIDWLRAQINKFYSSKNVDDKKTISGNIDQTTEALLGLTINKAALGDIVTLTTRVSGRSMGPDVIESWAQHNRRFLIDDAFRYMDLTTLESRNNDTPVDNQQLSLQTNDIQQQFYGTAKVLAESRIITKGIADQCQRDANALLSKAAKPSISAANLDRLQNELSIMSKHIKNGDHDD